MITLNLASLPVKSELILGELGVRDSHGKIHGLDNLVFCPTCHCADLFIRDNTVVSRDCHYIAATIKDEE